MVYPLSNRNRSDKPDRGRRELLKLAGLAGLGWAIGLDAPDLDAQAQDLWAQADSIRARIVPPMFPNRDFDITRYGAVANSTRDATAAFRAAIDACSAAGGGRVVVPAGRFVTGPVVLRSKVNLFLEGDATIAFNRDPAFTCPSCSPGGKASS